MRRLLLVTMIFLAGCAPWVKVGGPYTDRKLDFSTQLPQGWMRLNMAPDLLITRDGVLLQNVVVQRIDIEEPLKNTKKKLKPDMPPYEISEIIIDDLASDDGINDLKVLENMPVDIGGREGFKSILGFKNKGGLKYKSIYCGFIAGQWFYCLRYSAPERYYFDKDVETFENILESFRLTKGA